MSTRKPPRTAAAAAAAVLAEPIAEPIAEQADPAITVTDAAETAAASGPVTPPDARTHYTVTSVKRAGRWRAGRYWTPEPTRVAHHELGADDWAAILADPALTVTAED